MKKINIFLSIALLGVVIVAGCGKNNPSAPSISSHEETSVTKQTFRPVGIIYEAQLGVMNLGGMDAKLGAQIGDKPYYWFDEVDDPSFNAKILIMDNGQSSRVSRTNSGTTWGKVRTFAIECSSLDTDTAIRIFVPSHSASVAWKLVILEEGGAWRNWVLQNSTGHTGYKDYDFNVILEQINAGSGQFTIEVVVEGAEHEWIELAELYVFDKNKEHETNGYYWYDWFNFRDEGDIFGHTPGWFDESTNPGFNGEINNTTHYSALIEGDATLGGKVMSPVIPWDPDYCQKIRLSLYPSDACFSIWIQEQSGAYRQWQIPRTAGESGNRYTYDLTTVTELAKGDPFSITIADVFGQMYLYDISIMKMNIH